MDNVQSGGYEYAIMRFYIVHIVVALPITILAIKLLVRFFTRERARDIFRSLPVLPLDLIYIGFGLLIAGIARRIPAFATHYRSDKDADFAGLILSLVLFFSACLVTLIDRAIRLLWQKFYAAWNLTKVMDPSSQQLVLPSAPAVKKITVVYLWIFIYWSIMIPLLCIEVVVAVEVLGSVLNRMR